MQLVQLIIRIESSYRTISYLSDLGLFQFKDTKRCVEMAHKVRFLKEQMNKVDLSSSFRSFGSPEIDLDDLEVKLGEFEAGLIEINANNEKLQQKYNELIEYKLVLQKAGEFFHSAQSIVVAKQREIEVQNMVGGSIDSQLLLEQEMKTDPTKQVKLGFVSGLLSRDKTMVEFLV